MYSACLTDEIFAHTFAPNFKLDAVDKYDGKSGFKDLGNRLHYRSPDG